MLMNQAFFPGMFHPNQIGKDLDTQREGRKGKAKRLFLSDVVSFLSRIFRSEEKEEEEEFCNPL